MKLTITTPLRPKDPPVTIDSVIADLLAKFGSRSFYFGKAYEIACTAHSKQVRKDGKPYITHVNAVIVNTYIFLKDNLDITDELMDIYLSVAALHDVVEDHQDTWPLSRVRKELAALALSVLALEHIVWNVNIISKFPKGTEAYHLYVIRVANNIIALVVKLADLKHNMSDLTPGNMLDKYQLTNYVLEQAFDSSKLKL